MKKLKSFSSLLVLIFCFQSVAGGPGDISSTGSRGGGNEAALDFQAALMTANNFLADSLNEDYFNLIHNNPENFFKDIKFVVVAPHSLPQKAVVNTDGKHHVLYINQLQWNSIENFTIKAALALHFSLQLKGYENSQKTPFTEIFLKGHGLEKADIKKYVDDTL